MKRKRVCIVGGGFAGISAAHYLLKHTSVCDVTLIDRRDTSDFLPLLPDVVSGRVRGEHAQLNLTHFFKKTALTVCIDEVLSIDGDTNTVVRRSGEEKYDYILLACGSRTCFYGNDAVARHAQTLDSVDEAITIRSQILSRKYRTIVVAGAGYTGIELMTNVSRLCSSNGIKAKLILVERARTCISSLPNWMQEYVENNLEKLGIVRKYETTIASLDQQSITLSDGAVCDEALLLWSAGVSVNSVALKHDLNRDRQGRFIVDEFLRLSEHCFVAGDAAGFMHNNTSLRMGVQFSLVEGRCAARNIVNSVRNRSLVSFKPYDVGYVVPLANNRACGSVVGLNVSGYLGMLLHYCMSTYRTLGTRNKCGVLWDVLRCW